MTTHATLIEKQRKLVERSSNYLSPEEFSAPAGGLTKK